jgi:hypothetical protein
VTIEDEAEFMMGTDPLDNFIGEFFFFDLTFEYLELTPSPVVVPDVL